MKNKPYPLYKLPQLNNLRDLVKGKAETIPNDIAFGFYKDKKEIINKSFGEFYNDIINLGTYLYYNGFKEKHVAIISENSYEYLVAFLALVNGGNVAIPIDKELSKESIASHMKKGDCATAFVSDKVFKKIERSENIELFRLSSLEDYILQGESLLCEGKNEYIEYNIDEKKLASIFFTSGTTGDSKGVMLSHKNMASDINSACKNVQIFSDTLLVLPLHHTFGILTAVFCVINWGQKIFINDSLKKLQKNMTVIKPQTVFFVPLFIETLYRNIIETAKRKNKYDSLLKAMKISDILLKIGIDLRKTLFKEIREVFGENLEYIICGGAELNQKYVDAFRSWGIYILNGYGITECSPVLAVNRNYYIKENSIGLVLDGCTIRTSEESEILVSGDNVMLGYYNDVEATKRSLIDGFFHTGDLGYIDKDNFLYITGRKKNLIILSNGENVSPEELELLIQNDDNVIETVVYSDKGVITAAIYPTEEKTNDTDYFNSLIENINQALPAFKHINRVIIRNHEFEKNTNGKILRNKIGG